MTTSTTCRDANEQMKQPTTWRLTLKPLSDERDPSGALRVRQVLKMLLRTFRIQCIDVDRPAEQPTESKTEVQP